MKLVSLPQLKSYADPDRRSPDHVDQGPGDSRGDIDLRLKYVLKIENKPHLWTLVMLDRLL